MKISFNWLSDYIDLSDYRSEPHKLASLLTGAGLEVEEMNSPAKDWEKVVVGKLLEVGRHPDADKLTLCRVDVGGAEPLQIVCGAKNHGQGDFVAVATVGAVLPGDFKIKQSKIRGVDSFGMLCSESELGLAKESEGILLLQGDLKVGTPLSQVEQYADLIFELNVTPNRADCLSHLGLARELSALLDRPTRQPEATIKESGKNLSDLIEVSVKNTDSCPRYCGRMIKGVKVGPSPDWLKGHLEAIGLNSVNNVVDVTNFVLFEYGQPLHAFDFEELKDQRIVVEDAKSDEVFTTLDGTEVKLNTFDLVIRDGKRAVALAGVVGGKNSGVSEKTQDIFLESAFFKAEAVRRTSRSHGIETDSCYRFSRGVDPDQTLNAMNRAAFLIQKVAGGEIQKGVVDINPEPHERVTIAITTSYVEERLGLPVDSKDFTLWMERLGCEVKTQGGVFSVRPQIFRWDLQIKEDLVEEYARLVGYDQITERLPVLASEPSQHVAQYHQTKRVSQILTGLGVDQTVNYAFISPAQSQEIWGTTSLDSLGLKKGEAPIGLLNPLSEELSIMRESLVVSLFKNATHNIHHGNSVGRLFEIAPAHYKEGEKFLEEERLAMLFWGRKESLWLKNSPEPVVFDLKSKVEALLRSLGAKKWRWNPLNPGNCPVGFHPAQTVSLFYEGRVIGILGSLHPALAMKHKLRVEMALAEFNFASLMQRQPRVPKFTSLPKFPGVERDIAFLAADGISADQIGAEIAKAAGPLLERFEVFDTYQDGALKAARQRSIAFRLRFQSDKETLKDEEVNAIRDKIVNSLCQKLGLEIR